MTSSDDASLLASLVEAMKDPKKLQADLDEFMKSVPPVTIDQYDAVHNLVSESTKQNK
jgi:hypothetical protein